MIVFFGGMFLFSLFLMLRIHYRHVVTAMHSTLPGIQSIRSTVQQMKDEVSSAPKTGVRTSPKSSSSQSALETRKKELEKELEIARKEREQERKESEKKLQAAQSSRHIPIVEKPNSLASKVGELFGVSKNEPNETEASSLQGDGLSLSSKKSGVSSFSVSIASPKNSNDTNSSPLSQKRIDFGVWETPPTSILKHVKS